MATSKTSRSTKNSLPPGEPKAAPRQPAQTKNAGTAMLALLRGINVGGHKRVPMTELRSVATALGFTAVQTYIQSGNLVFCTTLTPVAAEARLEQAIQAHFGFAVPVVCRTRAQWEHYAEGSAFPDAATERPNLLHLGLAKATAIPGAGEALSRYATAGERFHIDGDAIWLDYAAGVARSKLTPVVLDRAFGSAVTARNWRTVQALLQHLQESVS